MDVNITVEEFKNANPYSTICAREKTIHESINVPIEVYYTNGKYNSRSDKYGCRSDFIMFVGGKQISDVLWFPCQIKENDIYTIGKEMIDAYLNNCDFEDLDNELKYGVPCDEFRGKYKSCNDCPRNAGDCMGATYCAPMSVNLWPIHEKWNDTYGEDSVATKESAMEIVKESLYSLSRCKALTKVDCQELMKMIKKMEKETKNN